MLTQITRAALITALALLFVPNVQAQGSGRRGSIYNANHSPVQLVANKTARRKGDLVTVIISEIQDVKNEEKTDLTKNSSLDYQISNLNVLPQAFTPLPGVTTGKSDGFSGNAKVEKKGRFEARLTAVVMDTLPNGNLVIQGRRELRIDQELKVIEFTGIIRRYDVKSNNTILSESVADARVRYSGSGPMANTTHRRGLSRWLHSAIDWVWPF